MTGSVTLALWVAFWLQLDNPFWAPVTAAITCQPTIGASLRKGQFRIVGTYVGAIAIVLLTAAMPQSRIALLAGMTIWGGLAGLTATLLRNNAAYAASLSGYTAIIVFTDTVSTTPDQAFTLAITRATEISIGVLSAGFVLALTDFGDARRRLEVSVGRVLADVAGGLADTLALRLDPAVARERRRALIGQIVALDPLTDEVMGESSELRYRSRTLQLGLEGLLETIAAWRGIAEHFEGVSSERAEAEWARLRAVVPALGSLHWSDAPGQARLDCLEAAKAVASLEVATASERLLADRAIEALDGLGRGANGLALLGSVHAATRERGRAQVYVTDVLPALVNGFRVTVAMVAASLIWVELAWPGGQGAIVFAAVVTILFGPQAERASMIVRQFAGGVLAATALAAIGQFAVLPQQQSFVALVLVIGAVMVPAAALSAGSWQKSFFTGITFLYLSLLAPTNTASFDVAGYLNNALGIVVGVLIAVVAFRLVPPVAGPWRARRLLGLTLRDFRLIAAGRRRRTRRAWLGIVTARLSTMPDATSVDQARLVAAISAGQAVISLRRASRTLAPPGDLAATDAFEAAMVALASGRVTAAVERLSRYAAAQSSAPDALRAEGEALLLRDVIARHADYFGG